MFFSMENRRNLNFTKVKYSNVILVQNVLIFMVLFLFIFFRLHPFLLYETQNPIFFTNYSFLKEHLLLPGGLVRCFSNFCSQGLEDKIIGALLLTGIIGIISILTQKIINILWKAEIHTIHWIPGLFLLFMYVNYQTPLSLAIGTAIVLIFTWIFFTLAPKHIGFRIGLYTIFSGILYWSSAGPLLLFALYCVIWEWLTSKSLIKLAAYLLIPTIYFVIGPAFIFPVFFKQSLITNLSLEAPYPPTFARWGFLLFFLLIGCLSFIIRFLRKPLEIRFNRVKIQTWMAGNILLLSILFITGWIIFDSSLSKRLMLFRAGQKNDWETVLHLGKDPSIIDANTAAFVNRALWHTGQLLDSAFAYPQSSGTIGLLPNKELCVKNPELASKLFLELGLASESLRWSMEYMEVLGETPEILKRIGLIYLLKDEKETAKIFFKNLEYTLQGHKTAKYFLKVADEDLLKKDKNLQQFSNFIPDVDFVSIGNLSDRELEILLKRNPENRMAFEYWVAYQLLKGNLASLWSKIDHFKTLGYPRIPRHVQEALILYASLSKRTEFEPLKPYVENSIVLRFSEFQKALAQQLQKSSALEELKGGFEDTYWYYLTYSGQRKS